MKFKCDLFSRERGRDFCSLTGCIFYQPECSSDFSNFNIGPFVLFTSAERTFVALGCVVDDNYRGRRIDSAQLLPELTYCLT